MNLFQNKKKELSADEFPRQVYWLKITDQSIGRSDSVVRATTQYTKDPIPFLALTNFSPQLGLLYLLYVCLYNIYIRFVIISFNNFITMKHFL